MPTPEATRIGTLLVKESPNAILPQTEANDPHEADITAFPNVE